MKLLFSLIAVSISTSAFAGNCPGFNMTCELKKINNLGYFSTVATKTADFVEINQDEISMPPNTCALGLSFSEKETGTGASLNASLTPELEAFMYAGKSSGGALSPQFSLAATAAKSFSMRHQDSKLECIVNALTK